MPSSPAATSTFRAVHGTELAYHVYGDAGAPLICLPGGPMRVSSYLGNLAGLSARQRLVMLDLRGTGASAVPADPASYRCDHQVADVEALRDHLGLDRLNLLGHSAGANLAVHYAIRHPHRVNKLVLITPSLRAVGLDVTDEMRREIIARRRDEPWYAAAAAAFERLTTDEGTDADWDAIAPLRYGRWDAVAQSDYAANDGEINHDAASVFGGPGVFDPESTRAALAAIESPVLLLAGEFDLNTVPRVAADYAALFRNAEFVVQPAAGHSPWLDDPDWFTRAVDSFLHK
jgi:pimeloyl-ACP methyl ester carboxylesterase